MCGLAGQVNINNLIRTEELDKKYNQAYLHLQPRGPDAKGNWVDKNCYLIHTRLKILDLSPSSDQPMVRGDTVICFNGEIYNYKYLKDKLIKKGYSFRSNGDTEVLLYAWQEWGEDMLNLLDGMFAIAIWNKKEKTLFLARDRFGKKPLVYSIENNSLYFASDVKSLSCISDGGGINKEAIHSLFKYRFVYEPITIYNSFRKLPPGNFLKFNKYGASIKNWFEIKPEIKANYKDTKLVKDLIVKAVEKRLVSDAPLGVFLSGGLDSAAILEALAQIGKKVPTYTIGYDNEINYYNETESAKKITKHFGFDNNTINLNSKDIIKNINDVLSSSDEPFADSSAIPMYMISKSVKSDIKVALTGDGGDELFGGYRKYIAYRWAPFTNLLPQNMKNFFIRSLSDKKNNFFLDLSRKLKRLLINSNTDIEKMQMNFLDQLSNSEFTNLFGIKKIFPLDDKFFNKYDGFGKDLNKVLARDFNFSLLGDMLVKLDRFSMSNSLEIRSPFLDRDLVDFSFSIPGRKKIGYFEGKKIIKNCYKNILPKWYLKLPKKGFEIPLDSWLKKDLRYLIEESTKKNVLDSLEIKEPKVIYNWKRDFYNGKNDNSWKLWTLISYSEWAKNRKLI